MHLMRLICWLECVLSWTLTSVPRDGHRWRWDLTVNVNDPVPGTCTRCGKTVAGFTPPQPPWLQ